MLVEHLGQLLAGAMAEDRMCHECQSGHQICFFVGGTSGAAKCRKINLGRRSPRGIETPLGVSKGAAEKDFSWVAGILPGLPAFFAPHNLERQCEASDAGRAFEVGADRSFLFDIVK